jgi:hypothetical protein
MAPAIFGSRVFFYAWKGWPDWGAKITAREDRSPRAAPYLTTA